MNTISINKKAFLFLSIFVFALASYNTSAAQTYKVACLKDYYPYSMVNEDNELAGILIDWWELWAKEANVDIVFVPTSIEGSIEKTLNGETDIIAGLFFNEDRAKNFDYSDNILRTKSVLFVEKSLRIDSIEQLTTPIGVVRNDLAHQYFLNNYPGKELLIFESFTALRYAAKQHNLNAFVYDLPNSTVNFKGMLHPEGYVAFQTLFSNSLRPLVKKGNQEMLNLITEGNHNISNDELFQIISQWGVYESENKLNKLYLIFGLSILVFIPISIYLISKNSVRKKVIRNQKSDTDWRSIIDKGENDSIEFKSSLRWDYRQEKINKVLEGVIIKTISAFLNTEGGTLLIGVDDEGNVLGLEKDYSSFSKKNSDGFLLTLTNLINQHLGKQIHKYISLNIISINEKDVCIVAIHKSEKPVFIEKKDKEEFYIRASASSQPLGLREAHEYIGLHWK